jgi:hypothetical protein
VLETLEDFVALAIANVQHPDLKKRIAVLFNRFNIREARSIVEESNRIPANFRGNQEKGAVGEAVVAAAIRRYFGRYDGTGFFDFQYPYWGDRDPGAKFPVRTMDIIFLKPTGPNSCIAFQIEAKNYQSVDAGTLNAPHLAKQIVKDERYLNPRIRPDRPLIPVWWFLQGLNKSARHKFEAMRFRVVDFTRDPFAGEIEQAFATHLPSGSQPMADISMRSKRSGTPKNIP